MRYKQIVVVLLCIAYGWAVAYPLYPRKFTCFGIGLSLLGFITASSNSMFKANLKFMLPGLFCLLIAIVFEWQG